MDPPSTKSAAVISAMPFLAGAWVGFTNTTMKLWLLGDFTHYLQLCRARLPVNRHFDRGCMQFASTVID